MTVTVKQLEAWKANPLQQRWMEPPSAEEALRGDVSGAKLTASSVHRKLMTYSEGLERVKRLYPGQVQTFKATLATLSKARPQTAACSDGTSSAKA